MASHTVGQGGPADNEPRRHPRFRGPEKSASSPRKYRFAESREEAIARGRKVGLPCVVKPVMSSSGKGQSVAKRPTRFAPAWDYAVANMRGDRPRVIVEELIKFDSEITLLTVATRGRRSVLRPGRAPPGSAATIGKVGSRPRSRARRLHSARSQARKIVEALGGHGLFGVEFFVCGDQAIFSELSARGRTTPAWSPHLAIPQRVRAAPAGDPWPTHSVDRTCGALSVRGDPRRPRKQRIRV